MMKLRLFLTDLRRAVAGRINYMLLCLFPFADSLLTIIAANLPAAAAYLPGNVYKWVGLAVVVGNVLRDLVKQWQAASGPKP